MLESFPNFENTEPYARICLAKDVRGRDGEAKSCVLFGGLDIPHRQKMDPDFICKFEPLIRELAIPLIVSVESPCHYIHGPPYPVHLTAYAAHCGLDRFVLHDVARNATASAGLFARGSILLAAVNRYGYTLASTLLAMGPVMNELCVVYDNEEDVLSLVPACIIAISHIFQYLVSPLRFGGTSSHVAMLRKLQSFSVGLHISVWVTVHGVRELGEGCKATEWRVRIILSDAIDLFEDPSSSPKHYDSEPSTPWTTATAQEMSSNEGLQAEGRRPELVRWLNEWAFKFHMGSPTDQGKILLLKKIEWSSDTQELVELRGWTRLYRRRYSATIWT